MLRLAGALRRLAGSRCPVCACPTTGTATGICAACAAGLAPRLAGFCPCCGELVPIADMTPTRCAVCSVKPRPWAAMGFHGVYEGLLRQQILSLKFGSHLASLGLLRMLLCQTYRRGCDQADGFDQRGPEVITAVPMHWRKLVLRGFNQSVELARGLAAELHAPFCPKALRKVRHTVPQSRLRAGERRANLERAFAADAALVRGRRVLVVDDVLTTGTTLESAAKTLLSAGAVRVEVLVLARDEKKCLTHSAQVV